MATIRIGTSGWHYANWRGPFYPPEVKVKDQFRFYASLFTTTELNNTFYRLPTQGAVAGWREAAPPGFVFAWKASQFITHYRRLLNAEDSIALNFGRMAILGPALGPVLFQLPPKFRPDRERLARFLEILPAGHRYAFEFRHPDWYAPPIFELLAQHDVSLCLSDHIHAPAPREATASFVYVRPHGPSGHYWGNYSDEALADLAAAMRRWAAEGRDVYCYFDNDIKSAAPHDAQRLIGLVGP